MELNSNINYEKEQVRRFIATYRNLPILWDAKNPDYSKKDKRCKAYEKLLHVYRAKKYNATITDVKKKINSMRSNFRKDMKKVEESAAIGIHFRPSSWMYDELIFLKDTENSVQCVSSLIHPTGVVSEEDDSFQRNDVDEAHSRENDNLPNDDQCSAAKKRRHSDSNQNQKSPTDSYYSKVRFSVSNQTDGCVMVPPPMNYTEEITKVWAEKLKYLEPLQGLFAEKAINDILFEAQMGTLHRNSVKINVRDKNNTFLNENDEIRRFEPSQSSPEYKFSHSHEFEDDDRN